MLTTLTRTIGAIVCMLSNVTGPSIYNEVEPTEATGSHQLVDESQLASPMATVVGTGRKQPLTYTIAADNSVGTSCETSFPIVCTSVEENHAAHPTCNLCQLPHAVMPTCNTMSDQACSKHRFWVVSSRRLTWNTCQADLEKPALSVSRLACNGMTQPSSINEYLQSIQPNRRVVFYVHGNRTSAPNATRYGLNFFQRVHSQLDDRPTDWVIFSWPSAQAGYLLKDAREKAFRTDAQGLYLAWLVRNHVQQSSSIAMVGYSFGARVVSGSLHALGGGSLGNRSLNEPYFHGADISAGLVAAAFDADWMQPNRYHGYTTKNLRTLTLLYNHRDVALRNHWRLSRERSSEALGFSGPRRFGLRVDGTRLPVKALNCTASVRARHAERFYYDRACSAGRQMANLINNSRPPCQLQLKTPSHDAICETSLVP
ncbi:alpha/beta hydrolase [Planctomycetes bacterium K23_9]|uniref:Alpha/beta hydrolase family protein n=1 Tax=Stieleria marina TaxID=1930275 RepID=A0A517NTN0_9BACT|nr:hypothetical protein K239x_24350 [Planctomycetes bacterium K23_9]